MLAPCIVREARILRGAQHVQRGVNGGTTTHCHTHLCQENATSVWPHGRSVDATSSRRRPQQRPKHWWQTAATTMSGVTIMATVPRAPATSEVADAHTQDKSQRETMWRKIAKLSEIHPGRAAPTTCWDSLLPRSARCGSSLKVAIHDLCTHDENVVMGEVGYGGVGRGVVRGDAWVARGRWSKAVMLCSSLRWTCWSSN